MSSGFALLPVKILQGVASLLHTLMGEVKKYYFHVLKRALGFYFKTNREN